MKFNNTFMSYFQRDNNIVQKLDLIESTEKANTWDEKLTPFCVAAALQDLDSRETPYLPFYIRSDDKFFQVALFTQSQDEANRIMLARNDVALIATDTFGNHYLASIQEAKLDKALIDKYTEELDDDDIDPDSDMFESYEELPDELKAICDRYLPLIEEGAGNKYSLCEQFQIEVNSIGYTFDYGLSGEPFMLRELSGDLFAKRETTGLSAS